MTLADRLRLAGRTIHDAQPADRAVVFNLALSEVLSWPFVASPGRLSDNQGVTTARYASVVHSSKENLDNEIVPADNAAAVIDVIEELDLPKLRSAYACILEAKQLQKTEVSTGKEAVATLTLTIVFAHHATVPLETLAAELQRLNEGREHSDWLDLLVVSDVGVISNACQFPGTNGLGSMAPPAKDALKPRVPALYIIQALHPTLDGSFNKLAAFIVSYMAFFSPGASFPKFTDLTEGVAPDILALTGYQYNLSGELKPVPRHLYSDRYIAPLPMLLETPKTKELLGELQFVPWQDGGAIVLKGKFPLSVCLVFLGEKVAKKAGVINADRETQVSYVLPITKADFNDMLVRLCNQSNFTVRQAQANLTIEKMADEGTSSPFMARIYLGLLRLRDLAIRNDTERDAFDKSLEQVHSALGAARTAAKEIAAMWKAHEERVLAGQVAQLRGSNIHVDVDFNRPFRKEVNVFLNDPARALKTGMQEIGKRFGKEMGFMFQKQSSYENGLQALETNDPVLSGYLRQTRELWSQRLILARNALEHEGWTLPKVSYSQQNGRIKATQPAIDGQPTTEFVEMMLDRLMCFVEDFTAYFLQSKMANGITISEVQLSNRLAEAPERFVPTLRAGGLPSWTLYYHPSKFEAT